MYKLKTTKYNSFFLNIYKVIGLKKKLGIKIQNKIHQNQKNQQIKIKIKKILKKRTRSLDDWDFMKNVFKEKVKSRNSMIDKVARSISMHNIDKKDEKDKK